MRIKDFLFSRMMNKVIGHITKPFKTFRSEEPTHAMLQDILQYRQRLKILISSCHNNVLFVRWEAVKKEEQSNR